MILNPSFCCCCRAKLHLQTPACLHNHNVPSTIPNARQHICALIAPCGSCIANNTSSSRRPARFDIGREPTHCTAFPSHLFFFLDDEDINTGYSTYTKIHLIQANNCYPFSPQNPQHPNSQSALALLCHPHPAISPRTPSFCLYCTRYLQRMRRRIPTYSRKQLSTRRPVAPIFHSPMTVQAAQITRVAWAEGDTEGGYILAI